MFWFDCNANRAQAIRRGSTNCRSSRSSAYETPRSSSVNHTRESSDVCYNLSLSKTESSGSHKFDSVDIYKKDGYTRSSSDSQSSVSVKEGKQRLLMANYYDNKLDCLCCNTSIYVPIKYAKVKLQSI